MPEIIANRYQLDDELGAGGMGTVFRGIDLKTKDFVAIKRIKTQWAEPDIIERFRREGQALRDLKHPNIVKMHDMVEDTKYHYLIMEYLPAGDLKTLLKQRRLDAEYTMHLAIEIADALTRAHHLNIIHRDLKPANVLLARDGTPRITDFGVAHVIDKDRVTQSNAILGTLEYLSPEVLYSQAIDTRADIWSFGVMLFEMLAGERPFQGEGPAQLMMSILSDPTPDLEKFSPDAPVALVDLIYRMLEKDRTARVRSVRQVGLEIEDILHGRASLPKASRFPEDSEQATEIIERPKHNLPAQTTPFVGRESELEELANLLDDPRMRFVTLIAPGGMGKTRLAIELGNRYINPQHAALDAQDRAFQDGVYFIDLAHFSDPANIISTIADATGYQFQQDERERKQRLLNFLSNKHMLLIMDNYEHLLDSASLVTEILQSAPDLKVLVTSRQRLSEVGETLFHLSGMDFPDWKSPQDALNYAAVKLFMNSAQRALPGFELVDEHLTYVAQICRIVHGMPLGIVLAASWLQMLTPQEIAKELETGIDLLQDESGELPERQRSIRHVFDYSWESMTQPERIIFMKLSVFRGGFDREAAQAVSGANLRQLMSLLNRSLIRRDAVSARYTLHGLLRQYAGEKLEQSGQKSMTHIQHLQYFSTRLQKQYENIKGRHQVEALDAVEDEFSNILAAWYRAVRLHAYDQIQKMLEALRLFCWIRSRFDELQACIQHAQEHLSGTEAFLAHELRGRLLIHDILLNNRLQDDLIQNAQKAIEQHEDTLGVAYCHLARALMHRNEDHYEEAIISFDESIRLWRDLDDPYQLSWTLHTASLSYHLAGRAERGLEMKMEALELARKNHNFMGQARALTYIAGHMLTFGQYHDAKRYIEEAIPLFKKIGNPRGIMAGQGFLSFLHLLNGTIDEARSLIQNARLVAADLGAKGVDAFSFFILGMAACVEEDYDTGYTYFQQAHELDLGEDIWIRTDIDWGFSIVACGQGNYEAAHRHNITTLKTGLDMRGVQFMTWCLPVSAILLAQSQQYARSTELLALAVASLPEGTGWMQEWAMLARLHETLLRELGQEAYNAAIKRGEALDLEETARQLLAEFGASA